MFDNIFCMKANASQAVNIWAQRGGGPFMATHAHRYHEAKII